MSSETVQGWLKVGIVILSILLAGAGVYAKLTGDIAVNQDRLRMIEPRLQRIEDKLDDLRDRLP